MKYIKKQTIQKYFKHKDEEQNILWNEVYDIATSRFNFKTVVDNLKNEFLIIRKIK